MNLSPETRAALVEKIIETRDVSRFVMCLKADAAKHLTQGCMVLTGPQEHVTDAERRIAFCVQVRLGVGEDGSDQVLLRHTDGSLVTHENQFFYRLTKQQELLARPLFKILPSAEDFRKGYSCVDGKHETDFIVYEPVAHSFSGSTRELLAAYG